MKVFFMAQGSDHWWEARRGVATASDFDKIITPAKGELSKSADAYIAELVADTLCQNPKYFTEKGYPINTYAIQQGRDMEPEARKWLMMDSGLNVSEVGFCVADDFSIGCSPDSVVGLDVLSPESSGQFNGHPYFDATIEGTVELKVPLLKTHAAYVMKGGLPIEYKPQVHGHLVVTGAAYCEFVSYARDMPPLRVKVVRDEYTDKVAKAVSEFVAMYQSALRKVRGR